MYSQMHSPTTGLMTRVPMETATGEIFRYDPDLSELHGVSVQVGRLFAHAYRNHSATDSDKVIALLEAYKNLRRALPIDEKRSHMNGDRVHVGASAAHKATQGW